MVDDSGIALESSDTPSVAVESVVHAIGTQLVLGCVFNTTLGTIVAVSVAVFMVPVEGNPETFWSMFMNWALAALAVILFASAVWMGRRASLRPEYGLRGDCLVLRTKKQDWRTLIELGDVEEISLTLSDAIAETHYVSLEHAIRRKRGGRPTMFPLVVFSGWVLCWILAALLTGMSGLALAATGLVFGFGTPLRNRVLRDQRRFDRAQTSTAHVA